MNRLSNIAVSVLSSIKTGGWLTIFVPLCLTVIVSTTAFAASEVVTKQNIIDAILERQEFSAEDKAAMDLNGDNLIDTADLIHFLKYKAPDSLEGVYTGFFVRNNPNRKAGQGEVFGQVPLSLIILDEGSLQGMVNKTETETESETKEFKQEYYSLYFPKKEKDTDPDIVIVSDISGTVGTDLNFTISFKTESENLAPSFKSTSENLAPAPKRFLERTIVFTGKFSDENKKVLSGTYIETVKGIIDNWGHDLDIKLNGKFLLMKE